MQIFSKPHADDLSEVSIDGGVHLLVIVTALTSLFKARLSKTTHQAVQGEIQDNLNKILDPLIHKANHAPCSARKIVQEGAKVAKIIGSSGYEYEDGSGTSMHNNFLFALSILVTSIAIVIFAMVIIMVSKHQVHTNYVCDLMDKLNVNNSYTLDETDQGQWVEMDTLNDTIANRDILHELYQEEGSNGSNTDDNHGEATRLTVDTKQCQEFKINTKSIVTNSVITLLVVAVYEAIFIMGIAIHYIPVKASVVVDAALDRAKLHAKRIDCNSQHCPSLSKTIQSPSQVADPGGEIAWKLALSLSIAGISGFALASLHRAEHDNPINHKFLSMKTKIAAGVFESVGLPIVCALVIGMTVTFVYFTSAEAVEGRQVKRQVERTVDAAFERYETAMSVISDDDKAKYNHQVAESIYALKTPDTESSQKEINKRNAVYIKYSKGLVAIAGGSALILVILGMIVYWRKGLAAKRGGETALRYLLMAITSASLGSSISFIAEYTFLQTVVSNFEASNPDIIVNKSIQHIVDTVEECKPWPYAVLKASHNLTAAT